MDDSSGPDARVQTSVIERVSAILRSLSQTEPGGCSTSELAARTAVARPTVHRLLTALTAEGLVDREQRTGRWHPGHELYLLGAAAAARYDITRHARAGVARLARESGESAFLSARRGDETVCLLREDGSFPIRSFVLYEGARFPLGVVSAGLVVLALLPDREVEDYLARTHLVPQWGPSHSADAVRDRIAATRRDGYAVNPGLVVEGSWGMAAAVFDVLGQPAWALTLTGVESRFTPGRRPELGRMLLDEAHRLTLRLRTQATPDPT